MACRLLLRAVMRLSLIDCDRVASMRSKVGGRLTSVTSARFPPLLNRASEPAVPPRAWLRPWEPLSNDAS